VYNGNTSTFGYGADGLRHRETVNGTVTDYVIDGQSAVRELRAGVSQATYLTGITGPCYRRDDIAGTIRWYLYDGLGSVLGEVDPNGTVTATRKYDVYGAIRSSTGTSTSKHKFVGSLGHPSEDETGLINMRARYMDPVTGRFISEDPGRRESNWFEYVSDSPTERVDLSGLDDLATTLGTMGVAAGLLSSPDMEERGLQVMDGSIEVVDEELQSIILNIASSGGGGANSFMKERFVEILNYIVQQWACGGVRLTAIDTNPGSRKMMQNIADIIVTIGNSNLESVEHDDAFSQVYWILQ
jgi:RHS repeat-associated protein